MLSSAQVPSSARVPSLPTPTSTLTYVKLAWGNVRSCVRDYAVYFATLVFAACLLYAFTASGDYLLALDLTADQRELYAKSGDIMRAFSVFVVLVFAFLIAYANKFLVRRRKREFALYALLGMRSRAVSFVLVLESGVVGILSLLTGVGVGVALSPAFGALAAFVFDALWKLAFVFSPHAAAWTAGCFAVIMVFAAWRAVRDVNRHTLAELMSAQAAPERLRFAGRFSQGAQLVLASVLLAVVWGSCVFSPVYFIAFIIPMGLVACAGTYFIMRVGADRWAHRQRKHSERYLSGLRMFSVRQVESRIESTAAALACVCVLTAAAVCMMCAGVAFSAGMRASAETAQLAATLAPIGFVGVFYGAAFLVAAAAVLALRQLACALDSQPAYAALARLGADADEVRASVRYQVRLCFAVPVALAFLHDVFGLALVGFLAFALGSASFALTAAGTLAATAAVMGVYCAVTWRVCYLKIT